MKHQVRTLIRIIASGMVVVGGMVAGLEFIQHRIPASQGRPPPEWNVGRIVIGTGLIVLGIILFAVSRSLAERLTDDFED